MKSLQLTTYRTALILAVLAIGLLCFVNHTQSRLLDTLMKKSIEDASRIKDYEWTIERKRTDAMAYSVSLHEAKRRLRVWEALFPQLTNSVEYLDELQRKEDEANSRLNPGPHLY